MIFPIFLKKSSSRLRLPKAPFVYASARNLKGRTPFTREYPLRIYQSRGWDKVCSYQQAAKDRRLEIRSGKTGRACIRARFPALVSRMNNPKASTLW